MKKALDLYFTSDTHGHILPVDYSTGKEKPGSLLNLSEDIKKSGNTLVLDGGDNLQGTPLLLYYLEHPGASLVHPSAVGFRSMQLDYYTLGNHDFNFGYDAIRNYLDAMPGKCVCANIEDLKGELKFSKTVIHTLENGLKIGITGVVTDFVNVWELPEHLKNIRVTDAIKAAKAMDEALTGLCDLKVLIYHGGYEEDLVTGVRLSDTRENIACEIAGACDYDIILTGHQHMTVAGMWLHGTYTGQPGMNAEKMLHIMAEVDDIDPSASAANASGRNAGSLPEEASAPAHNLKQDRLHVTSTMIPAGEGYDEHAAELLRPLEDKTEQWLDEPIGRLTEEIPPEDKLETAMKGSRVAAFFNAVQLSTVDAELSLTSLGNAPIGLHKEVSIRDIFTAYPFSNTIIVKELSGAALRAALERCACYLDPGEDGKPVFSDVFLKPKVEHYNYDFYAGLDYAFDIRKPRGQRVVRMRRLDGTEIKASDRIRVAMSNYRSTGTGGYPMIGEAKTVYSGPDNVQDLLTDYVRRKGTVTIQENYKFQLLY